MNKQKALEKIAAEISVCKVCQQDKIGISVPGEGDSDADIVFLGEAPGKQEAETGKPFIGRAGKVLRALLNDIGLDAKDVFITSPVKYLPKHVTPTLEEIAHGRTHLLQQLDIIKPKVVVLMGRVACQAMLQKHYPIADEHGKIVEERGVKYFISYHPAACLYSPKLKAVIQEDFKKLERLIK
jgi:uracil-DNA glycosylase family 4